MGALMDQGDKGDRGGQATFVPLAGPFLRAALGGQTRQAPFKGLSFVPLPAWAVGLLGGEGLRGPENRNPKARAFRGLRARPARRICQAWSAVVRRSILPLATIDLTRVFAASTGAPAVTPINETCRRIA